MQKAKELRDLSDEELAFRLDDTRKELYHLKNETRRNRKDQKLHVLPQKKREIARLMTVIHARKIGL